MVKFIGRKDHLEHISSAIHAWDTRQAIFIEGGGGVGKTRLMQEAYSSLLSSFSPTEEISIEKRKVRMTVAMIAADTHWGNQYWSGCKEMAAELGIDLSIVDGKNSREHMADELERELNGGEKPDAILIDVGMGKQMQAIVDRALEGNIKVVTVASALAGDGIIEVAQEEFDLALRSFTALLEDIDGRGKIAICWHGGLAPLDERRKIIDNQLQLPRNSDVKVVAEISYHKMDLPEGEDALEDIAQQVKHTIEKHPDLKAIWASTAGYGVGALNGLQLANRNDISIYSIDFSPEIQELMTAPGSPWVLTVAADPTEIGRIMVRVALQAAYGEKVRNVYPIPWSSISQQKLRSIRKTTDSGLLPPGSIPGWGKSDVGWTPWMRKLASEYGKDAGEASLQAAVLKSDTSGSRWLVFGMLDLDDVHLRTSQDLALRIVEQVGAEHFREYIKLLQELREEEQKKEGIAEEKLQIAENLFLEILGGISFGYRTVIFCDTTDAVEMDRDDKVIKYLIQIAKYLNNAVLVLSGRNAGDYYNYLREEPGKVQAARISLRPFGQQDALTYFQEKESSKSVLFGLDEKVIEKILFLSNGLPILIDLAVEWLSHERPGKWLPDKSSDELEKLPDKEVQKQRRLFERSLVRRMGDLHEKLDRFVLALSLVNPVNIDLCATILSTAKEDAQALINHSKTYSFIKVLPDGSVKLHDYMRDLILEYVWPGVEPGRKRNISQRATVYYEKRFHELETDASHESAPSRKERIVAEQWQVGALWLHHALIANTEKGVEVFAHLFDQATRDYRNSARKLLLDEILPYFGKLKDTPRYEVGTRYLLYLIYCGDYRIASKIAASLIDNPFLTPPQKLEILTRQAHCYLRLGDAQKSAELYKEAIDYSNQNDEIRPSIPRLYNFIGMAYRQLGKLVMAMKYYDLGLELETNDVNMASLLNNYGFALSLNGEYSTAINYCTRALEIYQEHHLRRETAMGYTTLGTIYRNMGNYSTALNNYSEALAIFEPENDALWLARLYSYRGAIYRLQGDCSRAQSDLLRSIKFNVPLERSYAAHVLGCVFWDEKDYRRAHEYFDLSYREAIKSKDAPVIASNIVGYAEMCYQQWADSNFTDANHLEIIKKRTAEFKKVAGDGFIHHSGRIGRVNANILFDHGKYERAFKLYGPAYAALSSRLGGYGRSTFADEKEELRQRIIRLGKQDRERALACVQILREYLSAEDHPVPQRDDLLAFCKLCKTDILLLKPEVKKTD